MRSLSLALTNRPVTGSQLAEWGLATEALERDGLSERADEIAASLASGSLPAQAQTKRLMREAETTLLEDQLAREAETISALVRDGEGLEGIQAFLAKRPPAFAKSRSDTKG